MPNSHQWLWRYELLFNLKKYYFLQFCLATGRVSSPKSARWPLPTIKAPEWHRQCQLPSRLRQVHISDGTSIILPSWPVCLSVYLLVCLYVSVSLPSSVLCWFLMILIDCQHHERCGPIKCQRHKWHHHCHGGAFILSRVHWDRIDGAIL